MEMNNRHLKPKPGSYFTLKSPLGKSIGAGGLHSSHRYKHTPKEDSLKENSGVITEDGHSGGTNSCYSGTANSIGQHEHEDSFPVLVVETGVAKWE
ncbi:conserved hypothetical protein [Culex quinquefasciatus]|uniref:Uncharacterized protein n=1 Tax=Culex quinquefasciatus TaxID=7176 RepID=B0X7M8_CULQU|nr:conserved hypothetical protein [Culex quinquefasciatus]|eukprot:XP_001865650.1 conserved hypothetical protein [Culex quinquefasciatus]